jgi:hypothetical protein
MEYPMSRFLATTPGGDVITVYQCDRCHTRESSPPGQVPAGWVGGWIVTSPGADVEARRRGEWCAECWEHAPADAAPLRPPDPDTLAAEARAWARGIAAGQNAAQPAEPREQPQPRPEEGPAAL